MSFRSASARFKPVRRLGQHFLVDRQVAGKLVGYADLTDRDCVLEVGAGWGYLTSLLAERAGKVVAVEVDSRLAAALRRRFSGNMKVEVVEGNVLKVELPSFNKVVSTPPYGISSKLIFLLIEKRFDLAVMVLQREVAERLVAVQGSGNYGRLSVMVGCRANVEVLDVVPGHVFNPRPKVDSAIVRMSLRDRGTIVGMKVFTDLVRGLFTQRRRKLRKVFLHYAELRWRDLAEELVRRMELPDRRVYELSVDEFESLAGRLHSLLGELGVT